MTCVCNKTDDELNDIVNIIKSGKIAKGASAHKDANGDIYVTTIDENGCICVYVLKSGSGEWNKIPPLTGNL